MIAHCRTELLLAHVVVLCAALIVTGEPSTVVLEGASSAISPRERPCCIVCATAKATVSAICAQRAVIVKRPDATVIAMPIVRVRTDLGVIDTSGAAIEARWWWRGRR